MQDILCAYWSSDLFICYLEPVRWKHADWNSSRIFNSSHNVFISPSPPGARGQHRGPAGGGDPSVSRVLPPFLLSSSVPHTSPASLPDPPTLHPQLSHFLPPCQSWGDISTSVLPAPPSPHVRRPRYCQVTISTSSYDSDFWAPLSDMYFSLPKKSSRFMGCPTTSAERRRTVSLSPKRSKSRDN